ncbi:MAG: hydroxymethylbilane synthase [Micrococcaceae bacterium]
MRKIKVGTRASALALSQTTALAEELARAGNFDFEIVHVKSDGDKSKEPLMQLGGTGVFVSRLRQALLDDKVDIIVHSLKDLPTYPEEGISLATIAKRENPADVLCAKGDYTLTTLPKGAKVGTGSPRRAAQLLSYRDDLQIVDIRGNIDTRIKRIEQDLDAVILAYAGLERLGKTAVISEVLNPSEFIAAPGQGALAVECKTEVLTSDDEVAQAIKTGLTALNDTETRAATTAERDVLAIAEQGCSAPIGVYAHFPAANLLEINAIMYPSTTDMSTEDLQIAKDQNFAQEKLSVEVPKDCDVVSFAKQQGQQVAYKLLEKLK